MLVLRHIWQLTVYMVSFTCVDLADTVTVTSLAHPHLFTELIMQGSIKREYLCIGAGTIFQLGEQKLNDFSVGEAKIGEKQSRQIQSKCLCNMYFSKKVCAVYNGEFLRIFCVKSNLTCL